MPAPDTFPSYGAPLWAPASGRMLLFGGCASGFGPCPLGDLWAFDPATWSWTELTPASGPAARSNPAVIHDGAADGIWLIDGLTRAGYAAALWTLDIGGDAPGWVASSPAGAAPAPRASHDAAVLAGDIYLVGGFGNAGSLADLWVLDRGGA